MGIIARRLALEHLNCNVSLEIYDDTCLCLQCNDCDVIIMNFGPSRIVDEDDPKTALVCGLGILMAARPSVFFPDPKAEITPSDACEEIVVIEDFNRKFYESDNGQIDEGDENDEVRGNDSVSDRRNDSERISERDTEAAGGTCYFGEPVLGSPSQPIDFDEDE